MFACNAPRMGNKYVPIEVQTEKEIQTLESAFEIISSQPEFDFVTRLLRGCLSALDRFRPYYFSIASALRMRLRNIITIIGDAKHGVIARASKQKKYIHPVHLNELENVLHNEQTYFYRFTNSDGAKHIFTGENIFSKVSDFYEASQAALDNLTREFEVRSPFNKLSPFTLFQSQVLTCDRVTLEKIMRDSKHLIKFAEDLDIEIESVSSNFAEVKNIVMLPHFSSNSPKGYNPMIVEVLEGTSMSKFSFEFSALVMGLVEAMEFINSSELRLSENATFGPHTIITQKAVQNFWKACVNSYDGVDITELCDRLHQYVTYGKLRNPGEARLGASKAVPLIGHAALASSTTSSALIVAGSSTTDAISAASEKKKKKTRLGGVGVGVGVEVGVLPPPLTSAIVRVGTSGESSLLEDEQGGSNSGVLDSAERVKIDKVDNLIIEFRTLVVEGAYSHIFDLEEGGLIDAVEMARLVRSVPPLMDSLAAVLEFICERGRAGALLLCPPAPDSDPRTVRVVTDALQEAQLQSLLFQTTGVINIVGPKRSGKTTQLLSVVHSGFSEAQGVFWVDYRGVASSRAAASRTIAQLGLRGCNPCHPNNCMSALRRLLHSMKPGSTVVFDNIDTTSLFISGNGHDHKSGLSPTLMERGIRRGSGGSFTSLGSPQPSSSNSSHINHHDYQPTHTFFSSLLDLCYKLQKNFCFVFVSSSPLVSQLFPNSEIQGRVYRLAPLPPKLMESLAYSLMPEDPVALQIAASNQPGEMHTLATMCNLASIRKIAKFVASESESSTEFFATKTVRVARLPGSKSRIGGSSRGSTQSGTKPGDDEEAMLRYKENFGLYIVECAVSDLTAALSPQAKLLAAGLCHISGLVPNYNDALPPASMMAYTAPFTEAMAWASTKHLLSKDAAIWSCAWRELLDSGWVVDNPDIGYTVLNPPLFSAHSDPPISSTTKTMSTFPDEVSSEYSATFHWDKEFRLSESQEGKAQLIWSRFLRHWMGVVAEVTAPSVSSRRSVDHLMRYCSQVDNAMLVFSKQYVSVLSSGAGYSVNGGMEASRHDSTPYGRHLLQANSGNATKAAELSDVKVRLDFEADEMGKGMSETMGVSVSARTAAGGRTDESVAAADRVFHPYLFRKVPSGDLQLMAAKLAGCSRRLISRFYSDLEGAEILAFVLQASGNTDNNVALMSATLDVIEQILKLGQVARAKERLDSLFLSCTDPPGIPLDTRGLEQLFRAVENHSVTGSGNHLGSPKTATADKNILSVPHVYARMYHIRARIQALGNERKERLQAVANYEAALVLWTHSEGDRWGSVDAANELRDLSNELYSFSNCACSIS